MLSTILLQAAAGMGVAKMGATIVQVSESD